MSEFVREATPPVGCSSRNSFAGLDLNNQVRINHATTAFFLYAIIMDTVVVPVKFSRNMLQYMMLPLFLVPSSLSEDS